MNRRSEPVLCYVTDRRSVSSTDSPAALLRLIERAAEAGVDWMQIREKDLEGGELITFVRRAMQVFRGASNNRQGSVIVNDRLDVALAAGASGVHLGETSLPVTAVRQLCSSPDSSLTFGIGASCHSVETALQAERDGADYVFFGPIFGTPSKAQFGPPQGIERLREVSNRLSVPVLAIGGITAENAGACMAAGAAGIAAIRLFQSAGNLREVVSALRAG